MSEHRVTWFARPPNRPGGGTVNAESTVDVPAESLCAEDPRTYLGHESWCALGDHAGGCMSATGRTAKRDRS